MLHCKKGIMSPFCSCRSTNWTWMVPTSSGSKLKTSMASVMAAIQRKSSSGIRLASLALHVTPKLLPAQQPPWPWPGILLLITVALPSRDTGWRRGSAALCTGVVSTELQSLNRQWRVCSTLCWGSSKELSTSSGLQPATLQVLDRPARHLSAASLWIHAVSVTLLWFSLLTETLRKKWNLNILHYKDWHSTSSLRCSQSTWISRG